MSLDHQQKLALCWLNMYQAGQEDQTYKMLGMLQGCQHGRMHIGDAATDREQGQHRGGGGRPTPPPRLYQYLPVCDGIPLPLGERSQSDRSPPPRGNTTHP